MGLSLGAITPPAVLVFIVGTPDALIEIVLFESLGMVLNTGTEDTGLTVSVLTITTVGEDAGEERTPPADEAIGEDARIDEGKIGYAGCVPFGVYGQTVVYKLTISVVICPSLAGQLVTVGAQLVIV